MRNELKEIKNRKNKKYIADKFCEGWVLGVREKVQNFNMSSEEKELIEQYIEKSVGALKEIKTRKTEKADYYTMQKAERSKYHGVDAGKKAQLYHAMNGGKDLLKIK